MKICQLSIAAYYLVLLLPSASNKNSNVVQAQSLTEELEQEDFPEVEEEEPNEPDPTQPPTVVWGEEGSFLEHYRSAECDKLGDGCPTGRWCDTETRLCWPKREEGVQCNRDVKCLSENCRQDKCQAQLQDPCSTTVCPTGQWCDEGECYVDLCYEVECVGPTYCDRGLCLSMEGCFDDQGCPNNFYCDETENTCTWIPTCNTDDECKQGQGEVCRHGSCVDDGALKANGQICEFNSQCQSGFCDETILESLADPVPTLYSRQFNLENGNTNNMPLCRDKKVDGEGCEERFECQSNICIDFECTSVVRCEQDVDCPNTEYCDLGGTNCCREKADDEEDCDRNNECKSGFCDTSLFEDGNTNNPDLCKPLRVDGEGCEKPSQCASNMCVDFECASQQTCTVDSNCPAGDFCDAEGFCVDKFVNGKPCSVDNQCDSGFCNTGLFENSNTNNPDLCQPKKVDGDGCQADNDCVSNQCIDFECSSKLPVGLQCEDNIDCRSNICSCVTSRCVADFKDNEVECGNSCECKNGLFCDVGTDDGKTSHSNTCTKPKDLSDHCHENASCETGNCDVFVCDWGLCGTETCSPMLGEGVVGEYCVRDNMCQSNRCRGPQGGRSCKTPSNRRRGNFGW